MHPLVHLVDVVAEMAEAPDLEGAVEQNAADIVLAADFAGAVHMHPPREAGCAPWRHVVLPEMIAERLNPVNDGRARENADGGIGGGNKEPRQDNGAPVS